MLHILNNRIFRGLVTPILAGLVLAVLAPFGTDSFSVGLRCFYWISMTLAGGLGAWFVYAILQRSSPNRSIWIYIILQSIGATFAVTPFVFGLHLPKSFASAALVLFYIWVVAIVITAFGQLANREGRTAASDEGGGADADAPRTRLLDRLPPKFRTAELYAISAEDHYVRIYSAVGEHMLLMRLADAEDLSAPLVGLKPHRSWWVAEAGVQSVKNSNGKLQITLKSGVDVPVSRAGAKRLRAAGWH